MSNRGDKTGAAARLGIPAVSKESQVRSGGSGI